MIDKILDNYYAKKLSEEISIIFIHYYLDYKIENKKNSIIILAKPKKYLDYTKIWSCSKKEAFVNLVNVQKIRENLSKYIDHCAENNIWN